MMRALWFALLMLLPATAQAQSAATLIADTVSLTTDAQLIAAGNVEVLFDGTRLTAQAIIFDQATDTLQITGPIFIATADGTILTASRATLDPRIENGILQSARIVLDQQLQLAANQIDRVDGRYAQLYKTAVTSCRVCGSGPPLWDIRAERVVHDQQERQLYFENATFRVRGVPLLWVPFMRLPDPTLTRATGLLIPQQRNTTQLGLGVKLPYFITLGDHRDLTVTPYLSAETRTLELTYRQAFVRGNIKVDTAFTDDTLVAENRGYLFAQGQFDLANAYQLDFDIELTSDKAYLLDYGYSDKDRLDSAVSLLRVTDETLYRTRLTFYESLRDDELNSSLPPIIADLQYLGRITPDLGGVIDYAWGFDSLYRYSDEDGPKGRDVTRAGLRGGWENQWILAQGLVAQASIGGRGDLYLIDDDSSFDPAALRFVPHAQVTLRWPVARQTNAGATDIIEPIVQLAWAETYGARVPNEDSTRAQLDQGSLFSATRFAGEDAVQTGANLAAGLQWTRLGAAGDSASLQLGRVFSQSPNTDFTASSGLDGAKSDWLLAGSFTTVNGFAFDARTLWEDDGDVTLAEARIAWRNDRIDLGAHYNWQNADSAEQRPETVSDLALDATFAITDAWTLDLDGRYDVVDDRMVQAGLGIVWRNECVTVDVSASRRFASSSTVDPTTTFGISGSIGGFSTGRAAGGLTAGCGN